MAELEASKRVMESLFNERQRHTDMQFSSIEKKIDTLNGNLTKLVWIIVVVVVGAVLRTVIDTGGINGL